MNRLHGLWMIVGAALVGCGAAVVEGDDGDDASSGRGDVVTVGAQPRDAGIASDPSTGSDAPVPLDVGSWSDVAFSQDYIPPTYCSLPWGAGCHLGETCFSADSCARCVCGHDGSLRCEAVPDCDAGHSAVDTGPPAACSLPWSGTCPLNSTCNGPFCQRCACDSLGMLNCATVQCDAGPMDAGSRQCRTSEVCGEGYACALGRGCGTMGACAPAEFCQVAGGVEYCGCDGRTFIAARNCVSTPYVHPGPCTGMDYPDF